MKHLLTISALLVSSLAMGQMPYNPDSNGDDLIGATDLISVLGLYNTLMVDSSLTCDYEGTELEQLFGGLFDQTLVLDSVYVEYFLIDSVLTYLPGCPDPVITETILDRSYMLKSIQFFQSSSDYDYVSAYNNDYLGYNRSVRFQFIPDDGTYRLSIIDIEVDFLTSFEYTSYWTDTSNCCAQWVPIPFSEEWSINEDGIQVGWIFSQWVANCEHFRLIPYWSEAE